MLYFAKIKKSGQFSKAEVIQILQLSLLFNFGRQSVSQSVRLSPITACNESVHSSHHPTQHTQKTNILPTIQTIFQPFHPTHTQKKTFYPHNFLPNNQFMKQIFYPTISFRSQHFTHFLPKTNNLPTLHQTS